MSSKTLLFVDDHHVLYRTGTKRKLHPPQRHIANPVIAGREKPWEEDLAYNSVCRHPETGRYQMWYQAFAGVGARDRTHRCTVCYAESGDGVEWTRPNLGLYSFNGIPDTNIVLIGNGGHSDRYGASVLVDQVEPDPARRYKMLYFDFAIDVRAGGREYPGLCAAFSPDGIHWTKHPEAPLLRISYGNVGDIVPYREEEDGWCLPLTMSDAVDVIRDERLGCYAAYGKMWIDGPDSGMHWKHAMGRTLSKDFVEWLKPELLLTPDDAEPDYVEFHTTPVFHYNDCYFCGLQILNRGEDGGCIDIELAISRDSEHWKRPFRRPYFLPRGEPGRFDSGSIFTNSTPIVLEDEIRFYYGGYQHGATGPAVQQSSGIGMCSIPRDRFAGIKPTGNQGQITLRPQDLAGSQELTLNTDASRGEVRVQVLDDCGFAVRGFRPEDAMPITGDSQQHPVRWKNARITQLPPGSYLVRFHLHDSEVFALTLNDGLDDAMAAAGNGRIVAMTNAQASSTRNEAPTYRAGIVGLGFIGAGDQVSGNALGQQVANLDGTHAEALGRNPRIELVAGSSRDGGRRERFHERTGAATYADWREMLERERLDIVSVATYSPQHAEITIACAQAGVRAIYCEKPIATTVADGAAMVEACEAAGTLLVINHNRRFNPHYHSLAAFLAEGGLGELTSGSMRWGSGRLGNVGTHIIDATLLVLGRKPQAVSATLDLSPKPDCRGAEFNDPGGFGWIRFEGGLMVSVDAANHATKAPQIAINGTLGRAFTGNRDSTVEFLDGRQRQWADPESAVTSMDRAVGGIAAHLDGGAPFPHHPSDAVDVLETIVAFHISHARNGAWVELPLSEADRHFELGTA